MDRFDSGKTIQSTDLLSGTISDELDRIDAKVGKIGNNSPEQALSILHKLDEIYARLQSVDNEQSRRVAETQFEMITTRIRKEARLFIRDLGGVNALRQAREQANPPPENWWWNLDTIISERQQAGAKRTLITAGIVLAVVIVLVVVYQSFLAPDPAVVAVYAQEQSSRELMMNGDLEESLVEVDKGLTYDANDPTLQVYRGVILDSLGRNDEAQQTFTQAEKAYEKREEFLTSRGQAYAIINDLEKARVDVDEALSINPEYVQAYLLSGQIHETNKDYQEAIEDYDKAYAAADKNNQPEMAALARTRTAMLYQMINSQLDFPTFEAPTPTK